MTSRTDPAALPSQHSIRRARPFLGTIVAISVVGIADAEALTAIERGFAAVAEIHRLMSFHEAESDVSRLNRDASERAIVVDPKTFEVLRQSVEMAEVSGGVFDVTVASSLVAMGFLPRPDDAAEPDPAASWRDIALIRPDSVRFRRRLWVDLGGIAKGAAVDHAVRAMALPQAAQVSVNAGGDLRVAGPATERVLLRAPRDEGESAPVLEIENASLASSHGGADARLIDGRLRGPHLDGRDRSAADAAGFVSVVAETCSVADALTKIVLARGAAAEPILRCYRATAHWRDGSGTWRSLGGAA
jgi:thiamine biosynthesis lipoprotein